MTTESYDPGADGFRVLATDLDGTLVPLPGNEQNRADLDTLVDELRAHARTLIFVTGRHLESVEHAIVEYGLPVPDWLIADVGTSMYRRTNSSLKPVAAYHDFLDTIVAAVPLGELRKGFEGDPDLRLQEPEKQGRFKLSFYVDADRLAQVVERVEDRLDREQAPYSMVHSVDPFNGDGLIDLLPAGVSKAHALDWWIHDQNQRCDSVVFAGDSGNDLQALTAGYRAVLVGNAPRDLARRVEAEHRRTGTSERLYLAKESATSGVLEGCRWFSGRA